MSRNLLWTPLLAMSLAAGLAMSSTGCKSHHMDHDHEDHKLGESGKSQKEHGEHGDHEDDDVEMGSREIKLIEVPPAAMASFNKDFPGAKIGEVSEENHGEKHYAFTFTDAAGKENEAEYDTAGKRVED